MHGRTGETSNRRHLSVRAIALTVLAMIAFAGNSVIARLALRGDDIDPGSYTVIRLAAGAITLLLMAKLTGRRTGLAKTGGWASATVLFVYAIAFSWAYISLSAGTGALILFGTVQGTMIIAGLLAGDHPTVRQWFGWIVAFAGLVWLLLPGIEAPPPGGAFLMAIAGVTWGLYSLRGRREADALAANASSFTLALVPAAAWLLLRFAEPVLTGTGAGLAMLSGAVTSGVGYILWYAALGELSAMQAALVQLSVPAIATAGGVLLLAEPVTLRLVISSMLVLGGILLALWRGADKC